MTSANANPFEVVIVGGGVAALEGALALRKLAGDRVTMTMICPNPEFVNRPMRVREPFAYPGAQHYALDEMTRRIGVELRRDAFAGLDRTRRDIHTKTGDRVHYDALLLALGANPGPAFEHATTLSDDRLDDQLHGLIQDVEEGYVHDLAFISPSVMTWPLPLYELALMTAQRADAMYARVSIVLATPEDAPLAIFGSEVSDEVAKMLDANGIVTITSAHCTVPAPGELAVHPGSPPLKVQRILALPELFGPTSPGVPSTARGFIPIDEYCKVRGLDRVFAAGDATDFAVKHGGVAAQQADTAARSIAALAGAPVIPQRFSPRIYGVLMSLDKPKYLSAQLTGGHGSNSHVSDAPTRFPVAKIDAMYLAPFLDELDQARERTS